MKISWRKKNNLDEMQEQTLLHIEGSCFWILYVMLLVAVIGQTLFMEAGPREVLPELICFMAASIVMVVRCAKNGIWDRHFKPNGKTNLMFSILACVIVAMFQPISYLVSPDKWYSVEGMVFTAVIMGGFTFAVTFFLMSISSMATRRRREKLEQEDGDEE